MSPTQTTLTGDDRDDTASTDRESSPNAKTNLAPPDQRGGNRSCPWCLANPETFEQHGERPRCGHCDAAIPVNTEWYQRGEKIVV
jgi:ribosomal protein S27AE